MTLHLPLQSSSERGFVDLPFPHPAWLTLASAGDMRDDKNRLRVLANMNLDPACLRRVAQVHSRRVLRAEELDVPSRHGETELPEADGLVSGPGGPILAVGVGDCMPILLADLRTGAYGALHSGWRGTGILENGVETMRGSYGTRPADLVAFFGPCISGESYVVDEARGREFAQWGPSAVVLRDDRTYLDMRAANTSIAERLGIGSVVVADHCTVLTPELGSFRREGSAGYTGMLAMVGPADEGWSNG